MIRWGLCCAFAEQPIQFATTTAAALARLARPEALTKLSALCLQNAQTLQVALEYCAAHGIGCFRVLSQLWPLKTHPEHGYDLQDLPAAAEIAGRLAACRAFAHQADVRTCLHPDQFVVLSALRPEVVRSSVAELEYQAQLAELVGADVINIHAGGAYGDKEAALERLVQNLDLLSPRVRERLTLENDDCTYSPADLLPVCRRAGLPLVYDVHHHRLLRDELSEERATELARATWPREPLFHLSSPHAGWDGPQPRRHSDYIDPRDVPAGWLGLHLTVEVEARAKELAVQRLMQALEPAPATRSAARAAGTRPRANNRRPSAGTR